MRSPPRVRHFRVHRLVTVWATAEDVQRITGKTVSDDSITVAQSVIELHCNRTEAASASFRTVDLTWLAQAVAWQSVWMKPSYGTEAKIRQTTQDGMQVVFSGAGEHDVNQELAPLAQRALKNLSWMGARTIGPRKPIVRNWLTDDSCQDWQPL